MKATILALAAAFALNVMLPVAGGSFVAPAEAKAKKCTSAQLQACFKKCTGTSAQKNQCASECVIQCNSGVL